MVSAERLASDAPRVPGPVLALDGVVLHRRGRRVLDGLSVAFPAGTVTAVVGPSGAGKASLLRCLNRLEEPDAGRVTVDGRDVRALEPTELRRRVGMVA